VRVGGNEGWGLGVKLGGGVNRLFNSKSNDTEIINGLKRRWLYSPFA